MIRIRNGLILLPFILLLGCQSNPTRTNGSEPSDIQNPHEQGTNRGTGGVITEPPHTEMKEEGGKEEPEVITVPAYTEKDRQFLESAKSGDYQEIKKLLEKKGVKINIKDAEHWTALHDASVNGHTDIAKLLIQKGANVDEKDVDGWTPLLVAVANGHTNVVKLLIQNNADIKIKGKKGITPLHVAAVNGYNQIADLLVKSGADVNAEDHDGINPLSMAFSVNRFDMSNFLIKHGAKVQLHHPGKIAGIIKDALTGEPLSGASIKIFRHQDSILVGMEKTGTDGQYDFPLSQGKYILKITSAGYIPMTAHVQVNQKETTTLTTLRQVSTAWTSQGLATGQILNAFNGQPVNNATLKVRSDINVTNGTIIAKTKTDNNGHYRLNLPGGNYTIEASKNAYTTIYFPIVSIGKHTADKQNAAITPAINLGQIRIVLSWGEQPEDLDAHLLTPNIKGAPYHIYYNWRGKRSSAPHVQLDVDDKTSYGPETLTIYKSQPGTYRYYVHNYAGNPAITKSEAKVEIYSQTGLIKSYNVPISGTGKYWQVFSYDASTGKITTIDKITSVNPN
ncbi:MAG: ankyrin repeat domain-containing protein [Pseudomonadota bacterium]